jgi:putative redox protein
MKSSVNVEWIEKMHFVGDIDGFKIDVDASVESGGENSAPRPKPLMMVALGGCTGMDVVSILKKMQVNFTGLNIRLEGTTSEEHPKRYTAMKIIYELKGENLPIDKINRAIELSQEKYCGVLAVYKEVMDITTEVKIV